MKHISLYLGAIFHAKRHKQTAGDSGSLTVGLQDGSPAVHVLRDQQGPQKLPHLRICLRLLHPSLKLVELCLQFGGFQFPLRAAEIWNWVMGSCKSHLHWYQGELRWSHGVLFLVLEVVEVEVLSSDSMV